MLDEIYICTVYIFFFDANIFPSQHYITRLDDKISWLQFFFRDHLGSNFWPNSLMASEALPATCPMAA